jgi:hypothetical protein
VFLENKYIVYEKIHTRCFSIIVFVIVNYSGSAGWYNESYGGGWFMQDGTWIRNYNNKQMYYNTNAGDNTESIRVDAEGATQDHAVNNESDGWGYVGTSNMRWWTMYAYNGFGTSSLKYKTNVEQLSDSEIDNSLIALNNINSIRYKWKKTVMEQEQGQFADNKLHNSGDKPDQNFVVPSWLGFSVESLPQGCVDETGENYQYGAMFGLLIASTKALSRRVDKLSQINKVDFSETKNIKSPNINISDFGIEKFEGAEIWINFSEEFVLQLGNNMPVVTVTPNLPGVLLCVKETTSKGFKVVGRSDNSIGYLVNWIAMSKGTCK